MLPTLLPLLLVSALQAPAWHIETTATRHVVAVREVTLEVPNMQVSNWAIFAGYPQELPAQSPQSVTMTFPGYDGAKISKYIEKSPDKRPVLLGIQPANDPSLTHSYHVRIWTATIAVATAGCL